MMKMISEKNKKLILSIMFLFLLCISSCSINKQEKFEECYLESINEENKAYKEHYEDEMYEDNIIEEELYEAVTLKDVNADIELVTNFFIEKGFITDGSYDEYKRFMLLLFVDRSDYVDSSDYLDEFIINELKFHPYVNQLHMGRVCQKRKINKNNPYYYFAQWTSENYNNSFFVSEEDVEDLFNNINEKIFELPLVRLMINSYCVDRMSSEWDRNDGKLTTPEYFL